MNTEMISQLIDLRSDTVTLPTPAMREAMARAPLGDDVYGEDPTVNRLQEMAADMLGKEAALFVASGTMGNLAAILTHCQRGDEIILGNKSHIFSYETGGYSALGGVHSYQIPNQPDGTLNLADIEDAIRSDDPHEPVSRLVALENTHNRCGGTPISAAYTAQVGELAQRHSLMLHVDGARIFNAAAAFGVPARQLVAAADSVSFCLSKGLCAPVGSLLCGSHEFIARAHRIRKQLGGGMRQAGVLAAAGIVALESMVLRLAEDHARANRLATGLASIPGLKLRRPPQTNMVFLELSDEVGLDAIQAMQRLKSLGVLVGDTGPRSFRLVTHYWIDDQAVDRTLAAFRTILMDSPGLN